MSHCFFYILDENRQPVPLEHPAKWTEESTIEYFKAITSFSDNKRTVGRTQVGEYVVSTVFLMLDHNLLGDKPILFETMVFDKSDKNIDFKISEKSFGSDIFGNCRRYRNWDEAFEGHKDTVKMMSSMIGEDPIDLFFPEHVWDDLKSNS